MAKNRYTGISPFTKEQKDIFFGRDNDTAALYEKIRLEQQVLVYAKSGIGKSSLINAGVVPRFEAEDKYTPIRIRFTSYTKKGAYPPLQRIIDEINGVLKTLGDKTTLLDEVVPENEKHGLWFICKKLQLLQSQKNIILVFDQFEELFSYPDVYIDEFKTVCTLATPS